MTLAADLVIWARKHLGVAETPPGSNAGEPMRLFALDGEDPAPWCGRFVRAGFVAVGRPLPGNPWMLPSVAYMMGIFDSHGWMHRAPKPGDLIFVKRVEKGHPNARHVGIVEQVDGAFVTSIEGNYRNAVRRVDRHIGDTSIIGYGRVPEE